MSNLIIVTKCEHTEQKFDMVFVYENIPNLTTDNMEHELLKLLESRQVIDLNFYMFKPVSCQIYVNVDNYTINKNTITFGSCNYLDRESFRVYDKHELISHELDPNKYLFVDVLCDNIEVKQRSGLLWHKVNVIKKQVFKTMSKIYVLSKNKYWQTIMMVKRELPKDSMTRIVTCDNIVIYRGE